MSNMSEAMTGDKPTADLPRAAVVLDWVERALVLGLYAWLMARFVGAYVENGSVSALILLPSEGLVVFFMLIRRPAKEISARAGDWGVAFVATNAVFLVQPATGSSVLPSPAGATLMLMGLFIQLHAKITLARSFGLVAANRALKCSGPYQFVRHPMYLGYLVTHVGFLLMNPSLWNVGVYFVAYVFQIARILAEERLLGRDPRYREYMGRVRTRLIPGVF